MKEYPITEIEQSENGPHSHMNTYDMALEGVRLQALHNLVSAAPFDESAALGVLGELEALAHSSGYAEADSFLNDAKGKTLEEMTEDPEHAALHESIYERPGESSYFCDIHKSEEILFSAAKTEEARKFLERGSFGTIHDNMLTAYETGRDLKTAEFFKLDNPVPTL